MKPSVGKKICDEMKNRGTGPKLWARANGFHHRTVNQVLHHDLGGKRGGEKTEAIFAELIEQGYIDELHEFIEPEKAAS